MNGVPWTELGVGVAAVGTIGFIVREFLQYLSNHISRHTEALGQLVRITGEMQGDLKEFVSKQQVQNEALWLLASKLRSKDSH